MIAIIDYNTGNLKSIENALGRLGAEYDVTCDEMAIRSADRVLLPGVGEASSAMENLRRTGLDKVIPTLSVPVLGFRGIGERLRLRRCSSRHEES